MPPNQVAINTLALKALQHLGRKGVHPKIGDVADITAKPGQVDRCIQRISSKTDTRSTLHKVNLTKLDHALADAGDL